MIPGTGMLMDYVCVLPAPDSADKLVYISVLD